ncbi:unnamed protein product [Linum trigynum]|uniref:Uncharacterized protein n=1 Tax=Linum trigynum TaxID=586398 RepID=A0AAV2EJQ7_9ROSI
MENVSERALLKHLQKEQERERRRIRDRQRRQSMSAEERERHLARRRRNYQLRRQRAENARLELQLNQQATAALAAASGGGGGGGDIARVVEHQQQHQQQQQQILLSVPEASNSAHFNGLASNDIVVDPMQDSFKAAYANPVALEVAAHELAKLPKQPRIKHIKQLARSLPRGHHGNDNNRIAIDLLIKTNPALSCLLQQKGIRFTRLKRIARSLHSDAKKKAGDQLQNKTVEHNQPEVPHPDNVRQEEP